jgi:hypothetical protein
VTCAGHAPSIGEHLKRKLNTPRANFFSQASLDNVVLCKEAAQALHKVAAQ